MNEIEKAINLLYKKFIASKREKDFDITFEKKKLATLPYIGSKYGTKSKILFIGLDIGADEKDHIQSIPERRKAIEHPEIEYYNPHIAGTYFLSLYFLKHEEDWLKYWNNIKSSKLQSMQILKDLTTRSKILPDPSHLNFLSYVALTNANKFVTIGRTNRLGDQDRKYITDFEHKLLIDEIKILQPDVICFQGKKFGKNKKLLDEIKELSIKVLFGTHPSYVGSIRVPLNLINSYTEWK